MDPLSEIESLLTQYTLTFGEAIGTLMLRAKPKVVPGEGDQSNSIYTEERKKMENVFASEQEQSQTIAENALRLKSLYESMIKLTSEIEVPTESESTLLKAVQQVENENQQSIYELEQMQSKASIL